MIRTNPLQPLLPTLFLLCSLIGLSAQSPSSELRILGASYNGQALLRWGGFKYTGGSRSIAHEIGHAIFNLADTITLVPLGTDPGNLMSYDNTTASDFRAFQWIQIQTAVKIFINYQTTIIMVKYFLLFIFFSSPYTFLFAQENYMKEMIKNKIERRDFNFADSLLIKEEFQREVVFALSKGAADIKKYPHKMRDDFYELLYSMHAVAVDESSRKEITNWLLSSCNDPSEWLRLHNMHFLAKSALPEDFSPRQLKDLKTILLDTLYHRTPLYPIVGRLNWPEGMMLMKEIFKTGLEISKFDDKSRAGAYLASPKWRAAIALAKLGDDEASKYLIEKAKKEQDRNLLSRICEDFAFIKTPKTIDFIIEMAFSDYKKDNGANHLEYTDFDKASWFLIELLKDYSDVYFSLSKEQARDWLRQNRKTYTLLNNP